MDDAFVNIRIDVPDELAKGYDPTEILEHFINQFIEHPRMREDGGEFVLHRKIGAETTDLGRLILKTNCSLVHNKERWWRSPPA
jgi:hypothetical protein